MSDPEITRHVHEAMRKWAAAERTGDTTTLTSILTEDFAGIGPHGFLLDKRQWLERYDSGALVNEAFATEDVAVRPCGDDVAIVNGVQTQTAVYWGSSFPGRFRFTAVMVRASAGWAIANVQLSPMSDQ